MYQKHFSYDPNNTNTNGRPNSDQTNQNYNTLYSNPPKAISAPIQIIPASPTSNRSWDSANPRLLSPSVSASYWRLNFIIAFFPLLFWGCPIHLLFAKKRITNTRQWLKSLCLSSAPCLALLTIILVILSVITNIFTGYVIGYFFYLLLGVASFSAELLDYTVDLVRLLPIVIPMNLIWIKGYALRRIIASFGHYEYENLSPMEGGRLPKIPGCRMKLAILYLMIFSLHGLHLISKYCTPNKPLSDESAEEQTWYLSVYSIGVVFTFIFPVYCTFCWAIHYELMMLRAYIKSLIRERVPPKYKHFDVFKKSYRKVADHIMKVNSMFSIYLSVIIVVLGFYIFREFESFGTNVGTIAILQTFFSKGPPGLTTPGNTDDTSGLSKMGPTTVRLIVADFMILLLYIGIFGLTYWQAVKTNDEVRYLHVWLNDFVTEPESRVTTDLYNSYQLLKFYIHSRLEQERPAFLTIAIISMVPFLKSRLLSYRVIH